MALASNRPLLILMHARPEPYLEALQSAGVSDAVEVAVVAPDVRPSPDQLARAEILLAMSPPQGMLAEMPRLRWVQALTVGVDGWLKRPDLRPDLPLVAARGTHRVQMPENILGALFHLTKPYMAASLDQRQHTWTRRVSQTLAGKTLAILGLGAIGRELARKAAALEMRVVGSKRQPEAVPHVDLVVPPSQIDRLLGEAHFVVLLLPLTPATRDLMNRERLARMRPDAVLINFGRGELIVDADLVAAVTDKVIKGAVLDVFRTEPLPSDHAFWGTPGITVLPHIGGLHPDRDGMVGALLAENVARFLEGQPLKELVDRDRGY
ncbi:MAG: D-2-hydroxyacid dehydrogenase [Hyphomicrobiaceae bacterium]|nr:D-2-hydroxyacid dehydrogenase [Hyphomicrobiaceae bacterium]